jgi:hypothetical protein
MTINCYLITNPYSMSGWQFDYIENSLYELSEWYRGWNKQKEKYSENIKEIPKWLIDLLLELWHITHDIDWDLSGDSWVSDNFFELKRLKLQALLNNS